MTLKFLNDAPKEPPKTAFAIYIGEKRSSCMELLYMEFAICHVSGTARVWAGGSIYDRWLFSDSPLTHWIRSQCGRRQAWKPITLYWPFAGARLKNWRELPRRRVDKRPKMRQPDKWAEPLEFRAILGICLTALEMNMHKESWTWGACLTCALLDSKPFALPDVGDQIQRGVGQAGQGANHIHSVWQKHAASNTTATRLRILTVYTTPPISCSADSPAWHEGDTKCLWWEAKRENEGVGRWGEGLHGASKVEGPGDHDWVLRMKFSPSYDSCFWSQLLLSYNKEKQLSLWLWFRAWVQYPVVRCRI